MSRETLLALRSSLWATVTVVLVCVVLLVTVAVTSLSSTESKLRDQLDARAAELAATSSAFVQQRLDDVAAKVEWQADQPGFVERIAAGAAGRAGATHLLRQFMSSDPTLEIVSALDTSGRIVATTLPDRYLGGDFSYRDYFTVPARTGTTYVSAVYISVLPGEPLLENITAPIHSLATGSPIGYLTAARRVTVIQQFVHSFASSAGEDVGVTVTDQEGVTVATTLPGRLGVVDSAHARWLRRALHDRAASGTVRGGEGPAVVSFRRLPNGWVVAAQIPESSVTGPTRTILWSTGALILALVVLLAATAWLFRRWVRAHESLVATRARSQERQQLGYEVNDNVVQSLIAAQGFYDLGEVDRANQLLRTAARDARAWVGTMVLDDEGRVNPGAARRQRVTEQEAPDV